MRLHKLAIALTVGVLGATFAVAAPTGLPSKHFGTPIGTLELMLRKRQTSRLFNEADKRFADDPDSPDGHAIRGAAFAIQGWPTESIVSFELAAGGEFYEEEGLRYLAEALREVGRADEAAELRRELRMVPTPNPYAYIAIEANLVDDLRAAEAWDEALEAAEFLLETEPGNSIVHSTVADLMWAMGDVDEALFQHAGADPGQHMRLGLAFEDHRVDALAVQQLAQQQAGGAPADDGNLSSHVVLPLECRRATPPGRRKSGGNELTCQLFSCERTLLLARWPPPGRSNPLRTKEKDGPKDRPEFCWISCPPAAISAPGAGPEDQLAEILALETALVELGVAQRHQGVELAQLGVGGEEVAQGGEGAFEEAFGMRFGQCKCHVIHPRSS